MRRFPRELADLFTPHGRRLLRAPVTSKLTSGLRGALARDGRRFLAQEQLLDRTKAEGCLALLERAFVGRLERMDRPIPPEALWGMEENYAERMPKASRVWTAYFERRSSTASRIAEELGLFTLLRSESLHAWAELLNGRPLARRCGVQLLCYGQGDYAGPHNDHHPEDLEAQDGYLDLHLTFCNAGVARQLLVYEQRGHLSQVASVRTLGGLTAYRLPFWHYTTPLEARKGHEAHARRWVLLGTFLDAGAVRRARTIRQRATGR